MWHRISGSGYQPDLIVAITRGGYPTARVLADYCGLMDLVSLKIEHYHGPSKQAGPTVPYPLPLLVSGRRVLLVDDVSDSGDTLDATFTELAWHGDPHTLRTAVLHHKQVSHHTPEYFAQSVRKWRWITYPWAVVEDLIAILADRTPPPKQAAELERYLRLEVGTRLPRTVIDQVAPIVLQQMVDTSRSKLP